MNKKLLSAIGAIALFGGGALAVQFGDPSIMPGNLVAQRLEGRWLIDYDLTQRIDPLPSRRMPQSIEFIRDDKILMNLQEAYPRFKEVPTYMGGLATVNDEQHLFLLMGREGNSEVVLFTPSRVSPVNEPHFMLTTMACSRDPSRDLLILGGDPSHMSAAVYARTLR